MIVRGQGRRDLYDIEGDPPKQEPQVPFSALSQIRVEAGFFGGLSSLLTRKYLCCPRRYLRLIESVS